MPAELWEIENEVVDRILAQVAGINAAAADTFGDGDEDLRWLIQRPPSVLVYCPSETSNVREAPSAKQPICKGKIFTIGVELLFAFEGTRPRGEERENVGLPLLADVRDALWYYTVPDTRKPLDYLGYRAYAYNREQRLLYALQTYTTDVFRTANV